MILAFGYDRALFRNFTFIFTFSNSAHPTTKKSFRAHPLLPPLVTFQFICRSHCSAFRSETPSEPVVRVTFERRTHTTSGNATAVALCFFPIKPPLLLLNINTKTISIEVNKVTSIFTI